MIFIKTAKDIMVVPYIINAGWLHGKHTGIWSDKIKKTIRFCK